MTTWCLDLHEDSLGSQVSATKCFQLGNELMKHDWLRRESKMSRAPTIT